MTIFDTYTANYVQELVNHRLPEYTFEHVLPPSDNNMSPNIIPQDTANSIPIDSMQEMFKKFMEANKPKKDKDKVTKQNKTPFIYQGVNSKG